jgi:gas vesicle protein
MWMIVNEQFLNERILLSWAKNEPVAYPTSNNLKTWEHGALAYASTMLVGDFASFYAVYYDDFDFTQDQRQAVESYLSDWLINHDIDPPRMYQRCDLEDLTKFEFIGNNFIDINYCGSNRWRLALGAVYLGLKTGNQKLFTAGNRHLEIALAVIDKDGIYAPWARKGALALSYQRQLPEVLTLLAVAYESIGYDFYEHQLPHGKKIHEVYDAFFDFIYHPEKLNKYAFGIPDYTGLDVHEFDKLPLEEKWRREYINPKVLAAQSKGYVLRYRPDLMSMIDYSKKWGKFWDNYISVFVNISGVAVYEAFNQNVSNLLQEQDEKLKEKQEENRLRLKKNAEAIKAKKDQEQEQLETKKAQEQEQLLAEIPIYDMNDEALILNLDQAEFFEISPPNQQNKNVGWETHKAEIYGELRLENFQIPKFRPLAFKFDVLNESRLSINVGELNAPEFRPFTRHQASLQKECGLGLMNEYDWMSFVSETTNMKSAKNQQCHYDYFKDANDEEAWKLFQAVLGGTDSTLNYLEESVER